MENGKIDLKYPLMLVHGAGFRDDSHFYNYWGRIPEVIESYGIKIFFSRQDAWGTIEKNAIIVKESILHVLENTGRKKINLIAHSRGGLECRYLISALNMSKKIASLTTISTPHHGSRTMDFFVKTPVFLYKMLSFFVNVYFKILGDREPDFFSGSRQFTTEFMNNFNNIFQNENSIYYSSYATKMRHPFSDIILFFPHMIVRHFDGDCDGICSVESAKWGDFKGIISGKNFRGVSHADAVDYRRKNFSGIDIPEIYVKIINELAKRGF